MLQRGFKWRRQPMLVMATNSGSDRNTVCWQEHQHAIRCAAGTREVDEKATYVGEVIDDDTFAFVCSLDHQDDPLTDPTCWVKANPLLGVTVKEDYLAGVVRQAVQIPGKANAILRLHFCVWTDSDTAWMARDALEAVLSDFDPSEHAGAIVKAGIDLSATQDITAAAFCVETGTVEIEREDGAKVTLPTYDIWVEAWTPKDTLEQRALRDEAPYDLWVKDGWLNAVPGKVIRMDFVAARIAEIAAEYQFEELGYDAYAFRRNLEPALDEMGVTVRLTEHPQGGKRRAKVADDVIEAARSAGQEPPQGLWMPGSLRELENLILEKRVRLKRSPVLISAMMSAVIDEDPFGNKWLSKRKATNRIDAAVAVAMVTGVATAATPRGGASFWEEAA
jgi:phage terminase large subunit-like protein